MHLVVVCWRKAPLASITPIYKERFSIAVANRNRTHQNGAITLWLIWLTCAFALIFLLTFGDSRILGGLIKIKYQTMVRIALIKSLV